MEQKTRSTIAFEVGISVGLKLRHSNRDRVKVEVTRLALMGGVTSSMGSS
jgi:hypothetical protein